MRKAMVVLVAGLAIAGCGGGSSKPCTGGVDPAGQACMKNSDCKVTCVCESDSSHKHYRVTADLCNEDQTCASASYMCNSACLLTLGVWTEQFCTP